MRNARLDKAQAETKISRKYINLSYMAEIYISTSPLWQKVQN